MHNSSRIVVLIYGLCAIPVAAGLVMGYISLKAISGSLNAQGTVVGFVSSSDSDGTEAPLVDYQVDGITHRIRGDSFTSFSAYSTGESVSVLYKPEHPHDGTINSFTELWFGPVAFAGMGLIAPAFVHFAVSRQKKLKLLNEQRKQNPELIRLIKEIDEASKRE